MIKIENAEGPWSALITWPFGLTHLAPRQLVHPTIALLYKEETPVAEVTRVDRPWVFDRPGMTWATKRHMTARLDGLELSVPALDWGYFLSVLRKLELTILPDLCASYRLIAFGKALVMLPSQREALNQIFETSYDQARDLADLDIRDLRGIREQLSENDSFPQVIPIQRPGSN